MVRDEIEQLVKLQAMDIRLYAAEYKLAKVTEALKTLKREYERLFYENGSANERYVTLRSEYIDAKISLDEKRRMKKAAQKKLLSVQNSKEYEAALKEMDNLKRDVVNLEKQTTQTAEELKSLEAVIVETFTASEEKEYILWKAKGEVENKTLYDKITSLKKERDEFAATIKKSVIARYDRWSIYI